MSERLPPREFFPLPPLEGEPTWKPRESPPIHRDVFEFEHELATIMAARKGIPLIEAIRDYTSELRGGAYHVGFDMVKIRAKEGIDRENLVEFAYTSYMKDYERMKKVEPYHVINEGRFGCLAYDYKAEENMVRVHFMNVENAPDGPFSKEGIEQRKLEMHDLFVAIKERHKDAEVVLGNSWLYNLDGYRSLFPEEYQQGLHPDYSEREWKIGFTVLGQFINRDGTLRKERADAFLTALRALPADAPFADLYVPNGPVLPPYRSEVPISVFYEHLGIE